VDIDCPPLGVFNVGADAAVPLSALLICWIALTPAATAVAADNTPLIVFIVTHGCPNVNGDAAIAFAFAIPVLTAIFPIAAACSTITAAICNFLFFPAIYFKNPAPC